MKAFLVFLVFAWLMAGNVQAQPKRALLWFPAQGDPIQAALGYDLIIGPIKVDQLLGLRLQDPDIETYWYAIVRYIQPWMEPLWEREARRQNIDPEVAYLHGEDGQRIPAPDASKPWPMANMCNWDYQYWAAYMFVLPFSGPHTGVMVDHPILFASWTAIVPPVECTEAEYDRACEQWVRLLAGALGKPVLPNVSTVSWYVASPRAKMLQRIVRDTGGVYFQTGLGFATSSRIVLGTETNVRYGGN